MTDVSGTIHRKRYTDEEKRQLLANFDIEVGHRTRQIEGWLADMLENFRIHQEGLISRVPRLARSVTMYEFAKYNGDIQECLRGIQKERLGGEAAAIDKTTRKRKWVESQESEGKAGTTHEETSKGAKSARMMPMTTPKKKANVPVTPGAAQRTRLPTKTPGTIRTLQRVPSRGPSLSPQKPGGGRSIPFPRSNVSRPGSPSKSASPSKAAHIQPSRVPSSSSFNPAIASGSHPRWPRRDESMVSVNGSPLANPYQFGLGFAGWLRGGSETEGPTSDKADAKQGHQRTNSIIVRSTSNPSVQRNAASQQAHSRSNSNSGFIPMRGTRGSPAENPQTPKALNAALPSMAAVVSVQTRDGHVLEFDPLQTSPGEIDALEGITESAKKQAKEDIAKLVMQAVERWKIT